MTSDSKIRTVVDRLESSARVTVLTGAGVSVASGIPPFRGPSGVWKDFRPEDLATPSAFARDPKFVWEWYESRRAMLRSIRPNRGHEILALWSRRIPKFTLITQNVDGLHELAGTEGVIRFHGSLWDVGCWKECPESPSRWRDETCPYPLLPPPCPYCGGMLRPGVVWFGEMIDPTVLALSERATHCDLFFSIGTSALVHPAAGLIAEARSHGAFTVEVNPEPTPALPYLNLSLAGSSEEVLDLIEKEIQSRSE